MTDISVIKMIISVAVWRIYPSWVNDKLRAWEGLGHSRMFWARLSRDDFRSKLEIISFLSRVMSVSKSFFVSRAFERFGAKRSSSGAFGSDDVLEVFLKTPLRHRAFFLRTPTTWTTTTSIFLKISFLFPKQSRCYLPDRYGDPQAEQSTLVMEHRRQEWKLDFRALARPSAEGPWIVVAIGKSRVRRSIVQKRKKKKKKEVTVWLCEGSTLYHLQTSKFWGACFRDPMSLPFRASLFSWMWMYSCKTVRLQRGGKRRKAVIRDTSGIDHWGVTNLSALISFAGQGHCTVFRHVMQLSLLVLCWKSTLAVILHEIKKKRSLSNVGHRGTKAENLAWHSTG